MKKILLELMLKRDALAKEGRAIIDSAEKESRELTSIEHERFLAIDAEIRKLDEKLVEQRNLIEARKRLLSVQAEETDQKNAEMANNFRSFGEFMGAVHRASSGIVDERLIRSTGMAESPGADGGFVVGTEFASEIIKRMHEYGQVFNKCRNIPIGPNFNGTKIPGVDETSRANGSRNGGIRAYWVGEGDTVTSSKGKFYQVSLDLEKLAALLYLTEELQQDSSLMDSWINEEVPKELMFVLEDAIINGDGVAKPLGILQSAALVTVAKETGQLANTVTAQNITKMWSRCQAPHRRNAVWLVNQDVESALYTMGLTFGTAGVPVFMPPGGYSQSPYGTILGRPVIAIEQCQTLGTVGDIILADLNAYYLATKGQIKKDVSLHVKFESAETAFRFMMRVDGAPSWKSALTPFKGTNTLSPFVALATRS